MRRRTGGPAHTLLGPSLSFSLLSSTPGTQLGIFRVLSISIIVMPFVHVCVHARDCMCVHALVCVCACVRVCVVVYAYVCAYLYVHMFMHVGGACMHQKRVCTLLMCRENFKSYCLRTNNVRKLCIVAQTCHLGGEGRGTRI